MHPRRYRIAKQSLLERSERIAAVGSSAWTPATPGRSSRRQPSSASSASSRTSRTGHRPIRLARPPLRPGALPWALDSTEGSEDLPPLLNYRIVLADHSIRHLRGLTAYISDDEHGNRQLAGTIQDFTEHLRAEQEIAAISVVSRVLADWQSLQGWGRRPPARARAGDEIRRRGSLGPPRRAARFGCDVARA